MTRTNIKIALLGLLLGGCANPAPTVEKHFGEAVRAARAQQTLNPEASLNRDPVAGLDGQAGAAAVEGYHKSFEAPPPPVNVFNIGVGAGSSGAR